MRAGPCLGARPESEPASRDCCRSARMRSFASRSSSSWSTNWCSESSRLFASHFSWISGGNGSSVNSLFCSSIHRSNSCMRETRSSRVIDCSPSLCETKPINYSRRSTRASGGVPPRGRCLHQSGRCPLRIVDKRVSTQVPFRLASHPTNASVRTLDIEVSALHHCQLLRLRVRLVPLRLFLRLFRHRVEQLGIHRTDQLQEPLRFLREEQRQHLICDAAHAGRCTLVCRECHRAEFRAGDLFDVPLRQTIRVIVRLSRVVRVIGQKHVLARHPHTETRTVQIRLETGDEIPIV